MSIPASIAISKMVYPEDDVPVTLGRLVVDRGEEANEEANAVSPSVNLRRCLAAGLERAQTNSWVDPMVSSVWRTLRDHRHFLVRLS